MSALARWPGEPRPGVRIVHYHYVFDDEREAFARQLEFLASAYEPVSLTEAVERLRAGRSGGREVVVTFDDGFRNQLVNAAPLLEERGFRACFFLVTGLVAAPYAQAEWFSRERLHLPRPVELLTWEDVAALVEAGHEIGSHTQTHPDLTSLSAGDLKDEVGKSRGALERALARPVVHFSAPYGDARRFSPAVSEAAAAAGYVSCSTAQRGLNTGPGDLYALRRHHLEAGWPVADVRYFLARA